MGKPQQLKAKVPLVTASELLLKLPLMHRQQLRKKASQPVSSGVTDRVSRRPTSYPKTRIRGSRLLNAARILALVELTRRLHQAYTQAYDKQAADWLLPQNPLDDKEIQRRIEEGKAWDKYHAWVICNTPIMNKYNAKLRDFHKIGGQAFWWEVGAGLGAVATIFGAGFGPEAGILDGGPLVAGWGIGLIIVGVHTMEKNAVNEIISDYKKEVTGACGPKPKHP